MTGNNKKELKMFKKLWSEVNPHMHKMGPRRPKHKIFFATNFTQFYPGTHNWKKPQNFL